MLDRRATISPMGSERAMANEERQAQVKALRELADSLEQGDELPRVVEGAVRRIRAMAKVRASIRDWQAAKANGTAKTVSAEEARKILGL